MSAPRLLVYTEEFLSPSMTFIDRQIKELQSEFEVSIIARIRRNVDLFPYEGLREIKFKARDRVAHRVQRLLDIGSWNLTDSECKRFTDVLRDLNPDVIHCHFGPSGLSILPIARAMGLPLVVTFHGFDASSFLSRPGYLNDLGQLFEYAHIITVSHEMRARLIANGADPLKVHCHYIGVPIDNYLVESREAIAARLAKNKTIEFLQVSNFVEKKGHEYTIRAFAKLRETFENCRLSFAGDGPLRSKMQRLSCDLGLENAIFFHGHQDSNAVANLMRKADCFVHHSVTSAGGETEGIPTVIMEAMASGLPVISTKHAGIPELITDGVDGLLVDERDIIANANAMVNVLSDTGAMGRYGRDKIEQTFDIRVCCSKLSAFLKSLCGQKNLNQGVNT